MRLCEWAERTPGVEVVRPSRCPSCGAAGRAAGEPLGLVGHGVREREVLGPVVAGGRPVAVILELRRFRCRHCEAVCTVGPAELVARRRYSGAAILLALALWARPTSRTSAAEVRRLVSPQQRLGATAAAGWASLRRWTGAGPWPSSEGGTWRERAGRLVASLLCRSPLDPASASFTERAFTAAAHVGRGPSC